MPANPSDAQIVAHIDGGSRGNPGPAAYGVVIKAADGSHLDSFSKALGSTTNNFAEYQALLAVLQYALECDYQRLRVESDSELLVRQLQGTYRVRSEDLKPLYKQARQMIDRFEAFSITHVPREQNREADRLVNEALDGVPRGSKWDRFRQNIISERGNVCQWCGADRSNKSNPSGSQLLEIHHIVKRRQSPDLLLKPSNVVLLCQHHHALADRGMILRSDLEKLVSPPYRRTSSST